jgi:uncharacterized protein YkwD
LHKSQSAFVVVLVLLLFAWAGTEPLSSWWQSGVTFAKGTYSTVAAQLSESAADRAIQTEADILKFSNDARQQAGLPALIGNSSLDVLALGHCSQMATTRRLSHDGFDRRAESALSMGLLSFGENCAEGYRDGEAVVRAWMDSPGHRANILDSRFRVTGIAYEDGYAVQVFGG